MKNQINFKILILWKTTLHSLIHLFKVKMTFLSFVNYPNRQKRKLLSLIQLMIKRNMLLKLSELKKKNWLKLLIRNISFWRIFNMKILFACMMHFITNLSKLYFWWWISFKEKPYGKFMKMDEKVLNKIINPVKLKMRNVKAPMKRCHLKNHILS
jgi:hypothetical protein